MFTTPIFVPLQSGLDKSTESTLGGKDLDKVENCDFAVDGAVQGRPGRAAAVNVQTRAGTPGTYSETTVLSSGFNVQGLMRHRDAAGERALIGCNGRLFSKESSYWEDRGHFACTRVDQLARIATDPDTRPLIGPDFYLNLDSTIVNTDVLFRLLDSDSSAERKIYGPNGGQAYVYAGGSARCGNYTAAVFKDAGNGLWIDIRNAGGLTMVETQIASDANSTASFWNNGLAPVICSDLGATVFYVIYRTTAANQYKVLRVNTSGTVLATFTGTQANLQCFWVTNTRVADNKVIIALGHSGGAKFKVLTASTMVDASLDSTFTPAGPIGGASVTQIVCGCDSGPTLCWWVTNTQDIDIGTLDPASASSASSKKTYYYGPYWNIVHQPLRVSGRMYVTLAAGYPALNPLVAGTSPASAGTWLTLDLSNLYIGSTGPFESPTLVARGLGDGHCLSDQRSTSFATRPVSSAVLTSDGLGWTFGAQEWTEFAADSLGETAGFYPVWVLNRVTFSGPRCVQAGGSTLFSGSVPHELTMGGDTYEAGFPFCNGRPRVQATAFVGGTYLSGSYSVICCWKWTDSSGQVHRSAPSNPQTVSINGTTQKAVDVYISNPTLTERPAKEMHVEVYMTDANPTADSLHYLQADQVYSNYASSPGFTHIQIGVTSAPNFTGQSLYTDADEFSNIAVPADGGIAALGRRVWVAGANRVYASKLLTPGASASWNDDGSLQCDLPAGAGRVLALEGMDDKLVVFCERGVFAIPDSGPDNVGAGPDIANPIRLTDLGCAGPRSTCVTDRGVVFCSPLDGTDAQRGGPWLLDRSLSITERTYLGRPAFSYFLSSSWVPEVAYSPERQQLYVTATALASGNSGVIVVDFRVGKWSTWAHNDASQGDITCITCVKGILWTQGSNPAPFSLVPGSDTEGGNYAMAIDTQHLAGNGQDGLGWSRIRGISVLHADDTGAYTLSMTAKMDQTTALSSGSISVAAPTTSTTWPSNRAAPEWRLPMQRCGSVKVSLSATPATAKWSAIRLDVVPLPGRSPTNDRH